MSVDEQLRTAVRAAASSPRLDVDHALRAVRARVETADLTERTRPSARAPRLVAALAACALLAGAVALPFALRSTRAHAPAASSTGRCGHALKSGFRSTGVIRFAQMSRGPHITFEDPVRTALGMCDSVLSHVHTATDDIEFAAQTNTRGDLLSLIVSTPKSDDTAALARAWAGAFRRARIYDAKQQIVEWQKRLSERVRKLHEELQSVDAKLAKLAPDPYHDVQRVDGPNSDGRPTNTVPPVPETGSVQILNLAFERLTILDQLSKSATQASRFRITRIKPDGYASVVSVSAPVRFPPRGHGHSSGPSGVAVAIGLLAGGVLLAAGSFVLGRRSRRAHTS